MPSLNKRTHNPSCHTLHEPRVEIQNECIAAVGYGTVLVFLLLVLRDLFFSRGAAMTRSNSVVDEKSDAGRASAVSVASSGSEQSTVGHGYVDVLVGGTGSECNRRCVGWGSVTGGDTRMWAATPASGPTCLFGCACGVLAHVGAVPGISASAGLAPLCMCVVVANYPEYESVRDLLAPPGRGGTGYFFAPASALRFTRVIVEREVSGSVYLSGGWTLCLQGEFIGIGAVFKHPDGGACTAREMFCHVRVMLPPQHGLSSEYEQGARAERSPRSLRNVRASELAKRVERQNTAASERVMRQHLWSLDATTAVLWAMPDAVGLQDELLHDGFEMVMGDTFDDGFSVRAYAEHPDLQRWIAVLLRCQESARLHWYRVRCECMLAEVALQSGHSVVPSGGPRVRGISRAGSEPVPHVGDNKLVGNRFGVLNVEYEIEQFVSACRVVQSPGCEREHEPAHDVSEAEMVVHGTSNGHGGRYRGAQAKKRAARRTARARVAEKKWVRNTGHGRGLGVVQLPAGLAPQRAYVGAPPPSATLALSASVPAPSPPAGNGGSKMLLQWASTPFTCGRMHLGAVRPRIPWVESEDKPGNCTFLEGRSSALVDDGASALEGAIDSVRWGMCLSEGKLGVERILAEICVYMGMRTVLESANLWQALLPYVHVSHMEGDAVRRIVNWMCISALEAAGGAPKMLLDNERCGLLC